MDIRRAYRERLYPTPEQEERLQWTLDQCRAVYNAAIEQRRHVRASHLAGQHLYPVPPKPEGRTPRRTPRPVTPAQQKRRERAKSKGTSIDDGLRWHAGMTYDEQVHDLVDLKAGFPELAGVNAQILQNVCKRVDLAYAAYSDRKAEYHKQCAARKAKGLPLEPPPAPPYFKGKRYYSSFTNPNPFQGWKLEHGGRGPFPVRDPDEPRIPRSTARRQLNQDYGRLVLSNIGAIAVRWSRPIEGTVKTITIRREGTEWYVTWSCVLEVAQPVQPQRPALAIDVGIESFATDHHNTRIPNPRLSRKGTPLLERRQRAVSAKVERHRAEMAAGHGSSLAAEPLRARKTDFLCGARRTKNLSRARALVAKAHKKIERQRQQFHHETANNLLKGHGAIAVEALSIDNMLRRPARVVDEERSQAHGQPVYAPNGASAKAGLNKSISEVGWGQFLFFLQYKAEQAGVSVVKVPAAGTSQTCSGCGRKVPKTLDERWHHCPDCGLSIHRDHNAARVIYQRAGFEVLYAPLPPVHGHGPTA